MLSARGARDLPGAGPCRFFSLAGAVGIGKTAVGVAGDVFGGGGGGDITADQAVATGAHAPGPYRVEVVQAALDRAGPAATVDFCRRLGSQAFRTFSFDCNAGSLAIARLAVWRAHMGAGSHEQAAQSLIQQLLSTHGTGPTEATSAAMQPSPAEAQASRSTLGRIFDDILGTGRAVAESAVQGAATTAAGAQRGARTAQAGMFGGAPLALLLVAGAVLFFVLRR